MAKGVITILGTIGGRFDQDKKEFIFASNTKKSFYYTKDDNTIKLKNDKYINTLPLLIENFDYDIIPIFTKDAKKIQLKVLHELEQIKDKDYIFNDNYYIDNENDFSKTWKIIDDILNNKEYDSFIIDVTHGFRHIPLLLLIDLIIVNINDTSKIEKILFAKEEIKPIKDNGFVGKYEFIDLKEYLDLANINYALSSFTKNYTVPNNIKTNNKIYNDFLDELEKFSKHILANSLDELFVKTNKRDSIINKLIRQIETILNNQDNIMNDFQSSLINIKKHIEEIKDKSSLKDFEKMYHFALNMKEKGYLLNAITLLNEASGLYAKEYFKKISPEIKNFIENFESKIKQLKNSKGNKKYQLYSLSDQSKNLYKLGSRFNGDFLYIKKANKNEQVHNEKSKDVTIRIKNYLIDNKNDKFEEQINLIDEISILRNNLAHGNSSQRLENVEEDIKNALKEFNKLFIKR